MSSRVHLFGMLLLGGTVLLGPSPALAALRTVADSAPAAATPAPKSPENPVAERERLRADLTRVQAEIDRLKAGGPGLRSDYLLRARMADAEALARRLTELDAQMKARTDAAVGRAPAGLTPTVGTEPVANPTDGPTELEAKADILTDQARRTQAQAVALQTRIDQVRGRRELHRRASELENDPFAPLEGSQRRLAPGNPSNRNISFNPAAGPPPRSATSPTLVSTNNPAGGATDKGVGATSTPTTTSSAPQVRDVLDPSASAQVRRNDAAATLPTDLPSMERQLAALKARAQHLDAQAKALRDRARAH